MDTELDNLLTVRVKMLSDIRELATHYFMPKKPEDQAKVGAPDFMKKVAEGAGAVEFVCSLVNIAGVMSGSRTYSGEQAIADLTFSLNTNPFWIKNSSYLMPLLSAFINASQDNDKLKQNSDPLWARMVYSHQALWLEVLPAIIFCLEGYPAMREKSLAVKQAFEKFIHR
jgi:hypothetical protein